LSNIGALHHSRGEFAQAIDAYRRAIELRPNAAATHRNLGDALSRMGRRGEAVTAYQRAVELSEAELKVNPQNPRMLATLAVYLEKAARSRQATARISEALAMAAKDMDVLYRAAVIHALRGEADEAMKFLRQAVDGGYSRARASDDDDFLALKQRQDFQAVVRSPIP
jgi:tetratricopeptide (TPR) repeat protein